MAKSWFSDPDFYGCIFVNAAVEYSEPGHPINACARRFKTLLRGFAREQARAGRRRGSEDLLADQIALLFEGATTVAQVSARPDAATTATDRRKADRPRLSEIASTPRETDRDPMTAVRPERGEPFDGAAPPTGDDEPPRFSRTYVGFFGADAARGRAQRCEARRPADVRAFRTSR